MTVPSNTSAPALFIDHDCTFKVIRNLPIPELVDGEVVVKVFYSGVNPADAKHGPYLGVRPSTLGYDFCGSVVQAGQSSKFKTGDVVAGQTPTGIGKPLKYGAHQEYLACPEATVFKVPANLPQTHAASLTTVLKTAADGLYNIFGFPLPGDKPHEGFKRGPLLIWGASTSVGLCMLQLARASGAFPIFVTASLKRHELLEKLGATRCFDYGAPDITSRIKASVEEAGAGPIAYVADCAGSMGEDSSASQAARCVGESAMILSVIPHQDKGYKMPLASANAPVKLQLGSGPVVTYPARPEDFGRMWKALMWAVDNYGTEFSLPVVDVFKGSAEQALEEMRRVADQGSFGKLVLAQPMS